MELLPLQHLQSPVENNNTKPLPKIFSSVEGCALEGSLGPLPAHFIPLHRFVHMDICKSLCWITCMVMAVEAHAPPKNANDAHRVWLWEPI